jgi:hypothetical protein
VSLRWIERLSAEHDWVERAEAWDAHVERLAREDQLTQILDMRRRHAVIANVAMTKAVERLRDIDAAGLTVRETVLLLDLAVKVERLARGEPTQIVDGTTTNTTNSQAVPEDRARVLRALASNPDTALELAEFAARIDEALESEAADADTDAALG